MPKKVTAKASGGPPKAAGVGPKDKSGGKKSKGRGCSQAKTSTHPGPSHADAAATGITVAIGRGQPRRGARDTQKLPSFYKL